MAEVADADGKEVKTATQRVREHVREHVHEHEYEPEVQPQVLLLTETPSPSPPPPPPTSPPPHLEYVEACDDPEVHLTLAHEA